MAAYDAQKYPAPGFDLDYVFPAQSDSSLYSASTDSDLTLVGDQQSSATTQHTSPVSAGKHKPSTQNTNVDPGRGGKRGPTSMPVTEAASSATPADAPVVAAKPKRVRTGCLTCRERHLKCDEGLPNCQNCRKSSRQCKRGVRLNFIDTQVQSPPIIPPTADWAGKCNSSGGFNSS